MLPTINNKWYIPLDEYEQFYMKNIFHTKSARHYVEPSME